MERSFYHCSLLLAAGLAFGCGKPKATAPSPPQVSTLKMEAPKPAAAYEWTAADREKITAFGHEIARLLNANDATAVGQKIDIREIIAASHAELGDASPEMKGFREGLEGELARNPGTFFSTLRDSKMRFLRTIEAPDGPRLLVRGIMPGGAATYLEFSPHIAPDGSVRIRELYNHATGANLHGIIRSVFITMGPAMKTSAWDRLLGNEAAADRTLIEQTFQAIRSKRPADVRAVYARLPESLKKNRLIYVNLVQILMTEPDDPSYEKALEDGVAYFPGDATVDFLGLDLHLLKGDFSAMQQAIDRLQQRLGPDAHLFLLEAVGKSKAGDVPGALASVNRALELEPDNEMAKNYRAALSEPETPAKAASSPSTPAPDPPAAPDRNVPADKSAR